MPNPIRLIFGANCGTLSMFSLSSPNRIDTGLIKLSGNCWNDGKIIGFCIGGTDGNSPVEKLNGSGNIIRDVRASLPLN